MMKYENLLTRALVLALLAAAIWLVLSVFSSMGKAIKDNCGKQYHIGNFLYTNLFCEVKDNEK